MKKLKEKIFENEKVQFVSELWKNKKTRTWVWIGIYFIFFVFLGVSMRMTVPVSEVDESKEPEQNYNIESIILSLEDTSKNDYHYILYVDDEEILGEVLNGANSFDYQGYNYMFVYGKLYLNNDSNLELVEKFWDKNIPVQCLTIDNILNNIKNKEYKEDTFIGPMFKIVYEVSTNEFMNEDIENFLEIVFIGEDNIVQKIEINYDNQSYILELM